MGATNVPHMPRALAFDTFPTTSPVFLYSFATKHVVNVSRGPLSRRRSITTTVSKRKLEANRKNAKQSTGPKTPSGKKVASRNAIKHGINAKDLIIRSPYFNEDPKEFNSLLDSLAEELQPETQFQEFLVAKIAATLWRSRRTAILETALIERAMTAVPSEAKDEIEFRHSTRPREWWLDNCAKINLVPSGRFAAEIDRYETRLERQLTRLYTLYRTLKQTSAGTRPPERTRMVTYGCDATNTAAPEHEIYENEPKNSLSDNNGTQDTNPMKVV